MHDLAEVDWRYERTDAPAEARGSGHGDADYYVHAAFRDAVLQGKPLRVRRLPGDGHRRSGHPRRRVHGRWQQAQAGARLQEGIGLTETRETQRKE